MRPEVSKGWGDGALKLELFGRRLIILGSKHQVPPLEKKQKSIPLSLERNQLMAHFAIWSERDRVGLVGPGQVSLRLVSFQHLGHSNCSRDHLSILDFAVACADPAGNLCHDPCE